MLLENLEIVREELPNTGELHLNKHNNSYKRYRWIWLSILLLAIAAGGILPILFQDKAVRFIPLCAAILLIALFVFGEVKSFARRGYALRTKDITYVKGYFWRNTTTIPFNRIQHSEISEGPIERAFGISKLKLYTAGGHTSDLGIPGLPKEEAERLKDFIAGKTAEHVR